MVAMVIMKFVVSTELSKHCPPRLATFVVD